MERLREENAALRQMQVEPDSAYQQLKSERDKLDRENLQLHEKNGDLDLQVQTLSQELEQTREEIQSFKQALTEQQAVDRTVRSEQGVYSQQSQAKKLIASDELLNLNEIRDRVLAGLKLGKQSPEYKRAKTLLDKFIGQIEALIAPAPGSPAVEDELTKKSDQPNIPAADWGAKTDAFLADAKEVIRGKS